MADLLNGEPMDRQNEHVREAGESASANNAEGQGPVLLQDLDVESSERPLPEFVYAEHEVSDEDRYAMSFKQLTQFELIWRRFRRHRLALAGLVVFTLLVLMALTAPWITRSGLEQIHITMTDTPPSLGDFPNFILGSDNWGHSIWTNIVYGARLSLGISVGAAIGASLIGTMLGAFSGYYGGKPDMLLMRVTDIVMAVPLLPLLITLTTFFVNVQPLSIMLVFMLVGWPQAARLVRSSYLTFREQEFTEAARAAGVSDLRIIFRHILPNALSPIIVVTTLNIAIFMILEATLDYLGLGLTYPSYATWGSILSSGTDAYMQSNSAIGELLSGNWWWGTFPGLFLMITVLSINFIGDGLRDALDVRGKTKLSS